MLPNRQEVDALIQELNDSQRRKTILCIDSYQGGALLGRLYGPGFREYPFDSLSQFLVVMTALLDQDTPASRFPDTASGIRRGNQGTFELQIFYRRNASWQGILLWKEQQRRQSFRSVLELISLLDSALEFPEELAAI